MDERRFANQLHAARSGHARACRWLWDRYAGQITGFLQARGTPDVDEVVNDVFLAAFRGLDRFDGAEPDFRAWLYAIARNKRVDAIRARRRAPDPTDPPPTAAHGGDVEHEAIQQLADDELRAVLVALTPDQRDVIVLRFVSDLSLEQTATVVGRPEGAVKSLQHRALEQLRKKFSSHPYPAGTRGAMS